MNNSSKIISIALAGLVLLPGCMRVPTYRSRPLHTFKNSCTYTNSEKGITVYAKLLNCAESSYIFDGRIESMHDTDIIYLSIYNLSSRGYIFSPEEISLLHLSYEDFYKNMKKTSSVARLSGALGLDFLSGNLIVAAHSGIIAPFMAIFSVTLYVTSLAFLGSGIKSIIMNRRMHNDLQEKILDKEVVIKSGDKYEGLIFVKSCDYESRFNIALAEQYHADNKIIFNINLQQSSLINGLRNE